MTDDKLSTNESIDAALRLDGDPQTVKQFYADWAQNYNRDTDESVYTGPAIATQLLSRHLPDLDVPILDAGCGTGLVGVALKAQGYGLVDGFDLSPEMADLAAATEAYRHVVGNIDMMRAQEDYPRHDYVALLSIGVFTLGHVPPQALTVLLELVRPSGLMLISTRSQYYDQTEFQSQVDTLLANASLTQVQTIWDAPYNHDGDAHYWLFRKT
jgi:predicted TPR repeat methyltransferase